MQFIFIIFLAAILYGWYFLGKPIFGKLPQGKRLERIQQSPNYKGGSFVNLAHTPNFAPNINMWDAAMSFLNKPANTEPATPLPVVHTSFNSLDSTAPQLIWYGHASYFMQIEGFKILVDPVFSGNASPLRLFAKSFKGTEIIDPATFPELDVLLLTHDHYDHLDYETILKLKGKFKRIITSLGVGAHLNHWGIPDEQIIELDWWEEAGLGNGYKIKATPARHFSGRQFTRNQSLWSSFVLSTPSHKIFLGGDSGYGTHFKEIGEKEGPFNLAILECGQYNDMWPNIHMKPEEVVNACQDLKAEILLPVHWGKFALALHPWNEPIQRVSRAANEAKQRLTTPRIGELVNLNLPLPDSVWWEF